MYILYYVSIYACTGMFTCAYVCMHTCMYFYKYTCLCVCMTFYVPGCMYMYLGSGRFCTVAYTGKYFVITAFGQTCSKVLLDMISKMEL